METKYRAAGLAAWQGWKLATVKLEIPGDRKVGEMDWIVLCNGTGGRQQYLGRFVKHHPI